MANIMTGPTPGLCARIHCRDAEGQPEAAVDNVEEFQKTVDVLRAQSFRQGRWRRVSKLTYVGTSSFTQKRQLGIPMVVTEYKDGKFETLFVGQVD